MITEAAIICLAMNTYMEARSEPIDGQMAVAQVVVRRATGKDGFDEARVCPVVLARRQFSWTGADTNGRQRFEPEAWAAAQRVARRVLLWGYLGHFPDRSKGATHYYTGIAPSWAKRMVGVTRIGRHRFLRQRAR